jgi:hypothetical protein
MKDEVINFYTIEKMKKYLPDIKDEQVKYTGMKLFKHFLICGSTGAGKSNAMINYIHRTSIPKDGTYKHIFVCYKTEEPFYQYLRESLTEDQVSFYKSVQEFPDVDTFSDQLDDPKQKPKKDTNKKKTKKQPDKFLVIFDDCINDTDSKALNKIDKYFTYGRKKFITLCFLSQSYFDTSTFIRKQISYVLLCSIRGARDLNLICKDYSSLGVDTKELIKLYEEATKKTDQNDLPFFKIDCTTCPLNHKFSRNFLDYFTIDKSKEIKEGGGGGASTLNDQTINLEGRYISECKELLDLVLHLLINFNNEANAIRAYNSSFMRDGTFVAITIEFTNLSREFIAFRGANFEPDNEPRMNTDLPQVIEDLKI